MLASSALVAAVPLAGAGQSSEDAYLDVAARRLVEGAKAVLASPGSGPVSYTARVHERNTFELVTERRAHVVHDYRYAARVRWARQGATVVRLEGHWSRYPGMSPPDSLFAQRAVDWPPEPGQDPFRFGLRQLAWLAVADSADLTAIVAPLDPGAERFYRYQSGDTTTLTLPGDELVRTVVVTAMPRQRAIRFLAALMWIDPETMGLARVAFRPAKPIDNEATAKLRDAEGWNARIDFDFGIGSTTDSAVASDGYSGADSAGVQGGEAEGGKPEASPAGSEPGVFGRLLNAGFHSLLPRVEYPISAVVVDYSLWQSRWWLPRSMTLSMRQALIEEPSSWDWEEYPEIMGRASVQAAFEIEEVVDEAGGAADEPEATGAPSVESWREPGDSVVSSPWEQEERVVLVPRDREAGSPDDLFLPASWDPAARESGGRSDEMAAKLARIAVGGDEDAEVPAAESAGQPTADQPSAWYFEPPLLTLRLVGWNQSEGLIVGSRLWRSFSWGRGALAASAGTRRVEPKVFLSLESRFPAWRLRVSAYHDYRLASVLAGGATASGDATIPGGTTADGDATLPGDATAPNGDPSWYAADGVRVWFSSARRSRQSAVLSLFAERHDEYGAGEMRAGATSAWRPWWGSRSRVLQGGGALSLSGTLEEESSVRAAATATAVVFPDRRVSLGAEAGAARTWGGPLRTDPWLLDPTGRWYRGPSLHGLVSRVALRARADVQLRVRFARLSVFSDWMRAYADWPATAGLTFLSGGVGVVLPGGVRFDVARRLPVDGPTLLLASKWRPTLSMGTAF